MGRTVLATLCMAAEGVATRVNTRALQPPVVSLLVMATITSTSSLCTLVTPDLIVQRSLRNACDYL